MVTQVQAERKRKKVERAMEIVRGSSGEPVVTVENYDSKISKALNWYNVNSDAKTLRKYVIAYINHINKKDYIYAVQEASDHEIRQIAIVGRLVLRDQYVADNHVQHIISKLEVLKEKYKKENKPVIKDKVQQASVVQSVQDRIQDSARKYAWDIDDEIDSFIKNKTTNFSMKNYLLSKQISGAVAKRLGEYYHSLEKELIEAIKGTDEQLVEGYSYLTKAQLKRFYEFIQSIVLDCNQQVVKAKANRMPRKRKEKPASVLVSKLKYLKEFPELKLKSVSPIEVVGATELWVYNTKYRKLSVYKGDPNLTVKGTTIINYSVGSSETRGLRKPEEYFKNLDLGKRALSNAYKTIKTKPSLPNGRLNDDCIILAAFK